MYRLRKAVQGNYSEDILRIIISNIQGLAEVRPA